MWMQWSPSCIQRPSCTQVHFKEVAWHVSLKTKAKLILSWVKYRAPSFCGLWSVHGMTVVGGARVGLALGLPLTPVGQPACKGAILHPKDQAGKAGQSRC